MDSQPNNISYGICKFRSIDGITCYMNSILHILQQIPIFADYFFTGQFANILKEKTNNNEDAIKNTVSYELYKLLKVSMSRDDLNITPTSFKRTIGEKDDTWNEQNHQDSQQFLNFLISKLEEEIGVSVDFIPGNLKRIINGDNVSTLPLLAGCAWRQHQSKEYSPLKEMFNGMTLIANKCSCCSNVSNNFEPFNTLQVSIPMIDPNKEIIKQFTIEDCLDHMIKEEQFDENNLYDCGLCGLKNRAFTSRQLWRTPKILIIHIKRFLVDNFGNRTKKLINNIKYPIYDLDISKYINDESPYKKKSKYNLIGVNLHQEFGFFGTNSGHYTSLVKNRFDNNWYLFNDSHDLKKISKKEDLQHQNAYLLFYYRND
jgi:ubiquitin C-terminal hydrolase